MRHKALFAIAMILLASCRNLPAPNTQATIDAIVSTTISATPTHIPQPTSPSQNWKTYSSPEYGFSIGYPDNLEILPGENNVSFQIGKRIGVLINDVNPLECRGDCPLVESAASTTVAGLDATRITGYLGTIGGNNPQQYISFVLFHNGLYYTFTLYELELDAPLINPPPSTIEPLSESDILLFEQIMETLEFSG